jgi:drug/metabolite transporter (DMT)-like permease
VYFVPVFGILSGHVLLDEQLGWSLALALVLILSGVSLAQRSTKA